IYGTIIIAAAITGPWLGYALVFPSTAYYKWIFLIPLILAAVAVLFALFLPHALLPRTKRSGARNMHFVGAAVLVAAVVLLCVGLMWAGDEMNVGRGGAEGQGVRVMHSPEWEAAHGGGASSVPGGAVEVPTGADGSPIPTPTGADGLPIPTSTDSASAT
ncbi:hypothetical protein HK104_007325, partial [Borealophlyctis nickersoniae]